MELHRRRRLPAALEAALLACEPLARRHARDVRLLRTLERPVSTLHQVQVQADDGPRSYWIKIHARRSIGDAEREYRFLRDAASQFRDRSELGIVEPVAHLEALGALVTEDVPGTPLARLIKRRAHRLAALVADPEPLERHSHACGRWLGLLHSRRLPDGTPFDLAEVFTYLEARLRYVAERTALPAGLRERMLRYLEDVVPRVAADARVRVLTHGDFAPYNALVSRERLVVLDPDIGGYFARHRNYCSRYEDLVHFHKFVRDMSPLLVSPRVRDRLASGFLAGYAESGAHAIDAASPAFAVFELKYKLLDVMGSWPSLLGRVSTLRGRLRAFERWFETRCPA